MSREAHVRFYEGLGVRLPGATHPFLYLFFWKEFHPVIKWTTTMRSHNLQTDK